MNGASSSQRVLGTHYGAQGSFSLSTLMSAYEVGRLGDYQVYVLQDFTQPCRLVTPGLVKYLGSADLMRLTTETGQSIVVPASGHMYDMYEYDPIHLTVNHPGNTRYFVGYYGSKQPDISRTVVKYELVGQGSVYTLDLPNMLLDGYAAVLCDYEE